MYCLWLLFIVIYSDIQNLEVKLQSMLCYVLFVGVHGSWVESCPKPTLHFEYVRGDSEDQESRSSSSRRPFLYNSTSRWPIQFINDEIFGRSRSSRLDPEVVMFTLFLVCRVLTIEVVEYSLSCRVLTLAYFSKLVEYSLQGEYSSSDDSVLL